MNNGYIIAMRSYPSPSDAVELYEITYWSENTRVKGLLGIPREPTADGLLYLRGGMQRIGMVRPARIVQYAQQGFVVFAPYYRGNRGGGGRDEFVGVDRFDAVHGVTVLRKFMTANVYVIGFSRGGAMALWTAILRDDIRAVVSWAGMTNIALTYQERLDMRRMMKRVIGGTPTKVPEAYAMRTPLERVKNIKARILIIHGERDEHVSFKHAEQLASAAKGRADTWYYPKFAHAFPPKENREVVRALSEWMKEGSV